MEKKKKNILIVCILIISIISLIIIVHYCLKEPEQNQYLVSVSFDSNNTRLTPYTEKSFRTYDCREVSEDYWTYPRDYDEVFNYAYEICNETYPELFITFEGSSNETFFFSNSISINELSFSINTSNPYFVVGCDWLEEANWSNKNMSLTRNNKSIQIDLIKLCKEVK